MALVRLECNLNLETAATLRTLSTSRGLSISETIRRAIAVYALVDDAALAGKRIDIIDDDGLVEHLHLL